MKNRTVLYWVSAAIGCAAACSSSPDKSGTVGGSGPDSGIVVTLPSGDGGAYEGGVVPLPDGGLPGLEDAACAGWSAEPEPTDVVLEFVVDDSNSMNDRAPGSTRTKWEETRDALIQAIAGLPASAGVGMLLFPNMATGTHRTAVDSSQCVNTNAFIPIAMLGAAGSTQRTAIDQVLTTNRPNSNAGTPTDDAYRLALGEMAESTLPGKRFIVLITDGQPTYNLGCVGNGSADQRLDPQPVIDDIAQANTGLGLRTFVIGSPGSEDASHTGQDFRPSLSQAAVVGGTAKPDCNNNGPNYCHFDMTQAPNFGEALRAALTDIAGQIVQCQYDVPAPPPGQQINLNAVNLIYTNGQGQQFLVLRNSADPCLDGWTYSPDQTQVRLCSNTCTLVKADPLASLDLLFGCATQTGPVL